MIKKYKIAVTVCLMFLFLIVVFSLPAAAMTSTFSDNISPYSSFDAPATIIFNFSVSSFAVPYNYISSYSVRPLIPNNPLITDFDVGVATEGSIYDDGQSSNIYFSGALGNFNLNHSDYTVNANGIIDGEVGFDYNIQLMDDYSSMVTSQLTSVVINDFYCWNNDRYDMSSEVIFDLFVLNADEIPFDVEVESVELVYRSVGETELHHLSLFNTAIPSRWRDADFEFSPEIIDGNFNDLAIYYIESCTIVFDSPVVTPAQFVSGHIGYVFYPDLVLEDVGSASPTFDPEGNPAIPLTNYTKWLGTAVSGFIDFQIFPGFTLGGLLMTIISFSCVIWFLKIFAGG